MGSPIKVLYFRKIISSLVILCFSITCINIPLLQAQEFRLPAPGVMVHISPPLDPPILKGVKIHPENPFRFDFILDKGDEDNRHPERSEGSQQEQLKTEAIKLIKYFLASLTIPEKDLWVNLSPYEKDRIIPRSFGLTEMGRDLLAEDYLLKQITASLIYPEDEIGKRFWKRIYEEAAKKFGTTNIPVNTFNKVWIVPQQAVVYENAKAGTAYVVKSKLKVMLEQDYLSLEKHISSIRNDAQLTTSKQLGLLGANIVREIVIPELSKEVNEDKNFAQLRQVYNSLILAAWYKKKIKDSILAQIYADKNKTVGVQYTSTVIPAKAGIRFKNDVEGLYQEYLKAFKKGVYNYIKEEQDPISQQIIPRKYFSGGFNLAMTALNATSVLNVNSDSAMALESINPEEQDLVIGVKLNIPGNRPKDKAMLEDDTKAFDEMLHAGIEIPFSNNQWVLTAIEKYRDRAPAQFRRFFDLIIENMERTDIESPVRIWKYPYFGERFETREKYQRILVKDAKRLVIELDSDKSIEDLIRFSNRAVPLAPVLPASTMSPYQEAELGPKLQTVYRMENEGMAWLASAYNLDVNSWNLGEKIDAGSPEVNSTINNWYAQADRLISTFFGSPVSLKDGNFNIPKDYFTAPMPRKFHFYKPAGSMLFWNNDRYSPFILSGQDIYISFPFAQHIQGIYGPQAVQALLLAAVLFSTREKWTLRRVVSTYSSLNRGDQQYS